jgi:hypothetical protein
MNRCATIGVLLLAALAAWLVAPFFLRYDLSFVHPHRFLDLLAQLTPESARLQWHDFVMLFNRVDGAWTTAVEYRPRFLNYGLILLDLKLRLAFYEFGVLHPVFSLSWPLQAASAWLLYRVLVGFLGDRLAAALAVLLYVTSTGFLSGITMFFMPGKPLSGLVFLLVIWLMLRMERRAGAEPQLFNEVPGWEKYAVLVVLFLGFFLDEVPLFAFAIPPLLFPERFFRRPIRRGQLLAMVRAGAIYAAPVVAFLVFVVLVVPLITQHFFNYRFNYFETLLGFGQGAAGAVSLLEGPRGGFSVRSLGNNFATLFGVSLVPWQVSPLVGRAGAGGVLSGQEIGFAELAILLPIFAIGAYLAWWAKWELRHRFQFLLLATMLYVVFQSMLNGRHVPYITGYYYGGTFAVFFALLAGFCAAAMRGARVPALAITAVAALVMLIQIDNFYQINESYIYIHNERWARLIYAKTIPLAPEGTPTTAAELDAIWRAWRGGGLAEYLASKPISAGAIFMVVELRWLDRLNCAQLASNTDHKRTDRVVNCG